MTATAPRLKTATNGHRRPVQIEVDRHQLVGDLMDWQTLAREAMYANGAALQILNGFERDALVSEAIAATHDAHARLSRLVAVLRLAAGQLDGRTG